MLTMAHRSLKIIAALLLAAAPLGAAESPVYLADGKTLAATGVTMIDGEQILFATPQGEKAVAIKDLVKWGELRDSSQGIHVVLSDGSLIVASDVRIADEKLVVETNLFGEPEDFKLQGTLRLPLEVVRAVLFRVPIDPLARDRQLAKVWQAAGNADQLLLANSDVIAGMLKKLEPVAGERDQPGPLAVTIETSAGEVTIAPDKIAAIIFNPQLVRAPPAAQQMAIGFADGSRIFASQVDANEKRATFQAAVTTIKSHPDENIVAKITSLQMFDNGAKYLSELKAKSYKHVPLVGAAWPLGTNENALGGKLRSGGAIYLRGLGMHAPSVVAYALDRPYAKFQAELALDDSAGEKGSVVFRMLSIEGNSRRELYKSPIVRGGDAPLAISIDVSSVKVVALLVEPADRGDEMDRANWLDARLLK